MLQDTGKIILKKRIFNFFRYLVLIIIAIAVLYPLAWTIISSIRDSNDFLQDPWGIPRKIDLSVYPEVWNDYQIKYNLFNSVMISATSVVISIAVSLLAAFAISRMKWRFSSYALLFFLMGLMIPVHSTIIPIYIGMQPIINTLGARVAIVLPYIAFSLPISVFILSNFMNSIPNSLEEAAVIDGCSIFQVFTKIIVPMSLPAVATVTIFNFIGVWNELLFALVFLTKNTEQTLPLGIVQFTGRYSVEWIPTLAAVSIAIIPSILVYILLQEKLIKGMTAGAIKG